MDKSSNAAQIIPAQNSLRMKLGGRFGGVDAQAIARAEAALKSLSGQFGQWLQDEIDKLDAARDAVRTDGWTEATAEGIYFRAHDLKGLGATYEFPLVTRIASSLCRLLDAAGKRTDAPLFLVDAHINTIKAAVRDNIRDVDHPVGKMLVSELEGRVASQLAA